MKLINARNYTNLFVLFFIIALILCNASNINFKNPNLILKAYTIQEKRANVSLLNEEFLQKNDAGKKDWCFSQKRKGV